MAKVALVQLGYGEHYVVPLAMIPFLEQSYKVKKNYEDMGDGKGNRYVTRRVVDEESLTVEVLDEESILPLVSKQKQVAEPVAEVVPLVVEEGPF